MKKIGQPERATQNRVISLFRDELGYLYLGDWSDRDGNSRRLAALLAFITINILAIVRRHTTGAMARPVVIYDSLNWSIGLFRAAWR
jgi:hypothetical protein